MSNSPKDIPCNKACRTLIKAFTFAGAILGAGAYGLARCVVLFAKEAGWITAGPKFGATYWWVVGGACLGFLASWLLVTLRGRA